jgi:signal transduction histidine kinase
VGRQRQSLRPLGFAVIAVIVVGAASSHPAPGLHGKPLGVTLGLCVFAAALLLLLRDLGSQRGVAIDTVLIAAIGGAGVALAALQPRGATDLAGSAAIWMAVTRLPLPLALPLAGAITAGLGLPAAFSGASSAAVLAIALLGALVALVAYFLRQGRASQEQTELLLAQLEDAREQQLAAAAVAERGRIAGELHDVLAHSLSAAAIQLQGARMLAERAKAEEQLRAAIDRASELVKDGLANAGQAVGALRGEELPNLAQLQALIAGFRNDMHLDVTLRIDGNPHTLPAEAGLALYRGAQEALTNVARYAPTAPITVLLRYDSTGTTLTIENDLPELAPPSHDSELTGVGGGRGLAGMRERFERLGGSIQAGPTENGWRVQLDLPA